MTERQENKLMTFFAILVLQTMPKDDEIGSMIFYLMFGVCAIAWAHSSYEEYRDRRLDAKLSKLT